MRMNTFYMAVSELGYKPEEVQFKCDKERQGVLVVTLKETGKTIGLYDTVAQWWL